MRFVPDFRPTLRDRFQSQADFSRAVREGQPYSPLYAALFQQIADWFDSQDRDDAARIDWLVDIGQIRQPFDIPLLIMAGLHRLVLSGRAEALAAYYATVGGRFSAEADLTTALSRTIDQNRPFLTQFIQRANVQTNETGRGLIWLLPLSYATLPAVHLVDLGASAGLNLLAERRRYTLRGADDQPFWHLGAAEDAQFSVLATGEIAFLRARRASLPAIASRSGCDMMPFRLASADQAENLSAYIWGDQPARLQRLREAIAVWEQYHATRSPISLQPVTLPDGLTDYLTSQQAAWSGTAPIVIYNTVLTFYLPERGRALRTAVEQWATQQQQPIVWLQWEPSDEAPPYFGWCAYTADLWHAGQHNYWHLGWVHPHGQKLMLQSDSADFFATLQTVHI